MIRSIIYCFLLTVSPSVLVAHTSSFEPVGMPQLETGLVTLQTAPPSQLGIFVLKQTGFDRFDRPTGKLQFCEAIQQLDAPILKRLDIPELNTFCLPES